ncbi:hypothetical protein RvY_05529-2 [Ramazzottius varieornatus]|uniref:Transmembrane protein n=1 Tax=Ramazzottius varieornatus TaxID=947166 RepID=A0A1D1UVV9_RAMVA|nr:hypothetical protein RvY_05529-2 [Ramazzottius varieornatus]
MNAIPRRPMLITSTCEARMSTKDAFGNRPKSSQLPLRSSFELRAKQETQATILSLWLVIRRLLVFAKFRACCFVTLYCPCSFPYFLPLLLRSQSRYVLATACRQSVFNLLCIPLLTLLLYSASNIFIL